MLNISFYRNSHVEPSTTVIMLLGTMSVCKIIIVVEILLARQCMFITKSEISLKIYFAYIEFSYIEVRLYRSNLEAPFNFNITGVDCIYICLYVPN